MRLTVLKRDEQGTGASRRLRRSGFTPVIIYGSGDPQKGKVDHNFLFHALKKEAFHSSILDLEIDGEWQRVLLRDVQYHPFRKIILHADFLRIEKDKVLDTRVPIHFINEDISPAVKLNGAIVNHIVSELHIVCLPKDLPEFIEMDLSQFDATHTIHAKDIKLPEGVELTPSLDQENPVLVSAVIPSEMNEEASELESQESSPSEEK